MNDFISVKETIPLDIKRNSIFNIVTSNVNTYTHGFHKYPAKFIPHIPKWAIEKYLHGKHGKTIIDPFCGSGTTLVEGILSYHNVIGIDIDPLSCLISKVKTNTNIDMVAFNEISNWIKKEIKTKKEGSFKPKCENIEHWFSKETTNSLSVIRTLINQITELFGNNERIRDIQDILIVCLSSIIRRVSYADNESQKTYVSHTRIKLPEEPTNLFLFQLNFFKERLTAFSNNTLLKFNRKIIKSSSIILKKELKGVEIDLGVTSPPYIKAVDYIYNQMVELFWIGDLFDMEVQNKQNIKKQDYIGTKIFSKKIFKEYTPFNNHFEIEKLDRTIQNIFQSDKKNGHKHAYITFKYFDNMEKHISEMSKCLNKGVHYLIVIGNSSVSNILVDTASFLTEIAERNGFKLTNKWGYKIKNRFMRFDRKGRGGRIDIDWILDLERI
jgi:hypothetical protein